MLDTLRKVKGAVATKDLIPVMTHFCLYAGRIQALDGRLAIDAPLPEINLDGDVTVPAEKLIKAVDACTAEPTITIKDNLLLLKQGRMKVRLPTLPVASFPRKYDDALSHRFEGAHLLTTLRRLRPFIATDATRLWATGALLSPDGYAYATNNVSLIKVECPMLKVLPDAINLPMGAVDELLRIGEEPMGVGLSTGSVTLHFHGDWWMTAQRITEDWPDIARFFADFPADLPALPAEAFDSLKTVTAFAENSRFPKVSLAGGSISTLEGVQSAEIEGFEFAEGMFNADYLLPVFEIAARFQSGGTAYFEGDGFSGVLVGLRS